MKILVLTLITNGPDPVTGRTPTPNARLHRVIDNVVLAEELGFDGYAIGERHERPFLSSAPPVVLSHIAARTSRITLFTGVTTLSLIDPVHAYEDYATLDQLADGRLELIIGKGNGAAQAQLFHVTTDDQWDRNAEGYELFRRLWREEHTTWTGKFRPPLVDAETWPPPRQHPIRVWHGSATSKESVEVAARYDGLSPRRQREQLETFQSEVAPALRAAVPSRPLAGAVPRDADDARPADEPVGAVS
jgi:alkanesulfonate monooxygenase SsuD/methylene tetrahydromethanopterin reductase-like flavin-dependent oxidoreductase (luciferase family)